MTTLAVVLAVVVGISLGLLGGGGSILMVPILVIIAGLDPKVAIATSLLVVGSTGAVGAVQHWRAGRVDLRTGLVFGAAGMVGAYVGGRMAAFIPGTWLLIAFGLMMAVTATAMLRDRDPTDRTLIDRTLIDRDPTDRTLIDRTTTDRDPTDPDPADPDPADHAGTSSAPTSPGISTPVAGVPDTTGSRRVGRIILDGVAVGLVTGLVGAGGGFLIVPALVLLGGLTMPVAVGTSLLVIAMKSAAGLAGYLASVDLDWPLALAVTAAAIGGSFLGTRLVDRTDPAMLRRGFGWFVVAAAILVLGQQVPPAWTTWLPGSALAWTAIPIAVVVVIAGRDLRHQRDRLAGTGTPPDAAQNGLPASTSTS